MIVVIIIIILLCIISIAGIGTYYYINYFEKPSLPAPSVNSYALSSVWKNGEILKANDYKISPDGKVKLLIKTVNNNGTNSMFITINDNILSGFESINTSNNGAFKLVDTGFESIIIPTSEELVNLVKSEIESENEHTKKISNPKINGIQIDNLIKNNKKYPVLFKNEYVYYYDENANLKGKFKFNLMDTNSNGFKYSISNTNRSHMFTDKIDYIVVKNDGVYLFNKDNKFITFLI